MTIKVKTRKFINVMHFIGEWKLAVIGYSIVMLLLLLPLLLHIVEPIWDALDFFFPSFTYLADSIREGRFPLWDPYTNCGYPFHADPQNYTLNPLAMLFGLFFDKASLGFIWFWAFHWWWGGFGMIWLAKHFGASPLGAFAAAISFSLSGFFLGHAEHTSYILVAAWLPWIFTCADRAVMHSNFAYALLAGTALGFCSYGGYPVMILFMCLALALWLGLRFLPRCNLQKFDTRSFTARVLWILATLAIAATILIVVWSPMLHAFLVEGSGYTDRVGKLTPQMANYGDPFTFPAAISLFFPYVNFTGKPWMGADISMTNAYMGILTIPFAIFWSFKVGIRRSWWVVAFVLFMFVVSLGGKYGLRTLLYYIYPPMKYMRFSAPFRLFWIFPVCLAAGLGLTHLIRYPDERRTMLRTLFIWTLSACSVAIVFGVVSIRQGIPFVQDFHRLFVPGMAILIITCAFLWYWVAKGHDRFTEYAPAILLLLMISDMSIHLYNNSGTVWNKGNRCDEMESIHTRSTLVNGNPGARTPGKPFGSVNAQQVIKLPLVQGYMTMKSGSFNEILCQSKFEEILAGPYRFWLNPGIELPPSYDFALTTLSGTGTGSVVPAFVEHTVEGLPQTRSIPGTFGSVDVRSYAPEHIEMVLSVPGTTGAFLVSTERYTAGWKVLVDGQHQQAQKVNLFFRGVFVPSGQHTVIWYYEPEWWPQLVGLSYSLLVFAPALGIALLWRRRCKQKSHKIVHV